MEAKRHVARGGKRLNAPHALRSAVAKQRKKASRKKKSAKKKAYYSGRKERRAKK